MAKIMMVANSSFTLLNFRRELIDHFIKSGHDLILVCPLKKTSDFSGLNLSVIDLPLERQGLGPLGNLKTFFFLLRLLRSSQPDIVLNYTIKPVIFSSLASRFLSKVKTFSFITGLGYVFTGDELKTKIIRFIVVQLYRLSLKKNKAVFFQNKDDQRVFEKHQILGKKVEKVIIPGSGVNLEKFKRELETEKPKSKNISFIFVGRILKDKGVQEFIEAASLVKKEFPQSTFHMVGGEDDNPSAIKLTDIKNSEIITYHGEVKDVRPLLQKYHVFVLPSYREGTPRSTLEAMALSMPIISTDTAGCRETVVDERNGFLVPIKNALELAKKMQVFIEQPDLVESMGQESLSLVTKKYDVQKVNAKILDHLKDNISEAIL